MSACRTLDSLDAELRRAVSQGSFGRSNRLLGEYAAELEGLLRSGQAGAAEVQTALALFEWARRNALSARAHDVLRLSSTRAAGHYSPRPAPTFPTLNLKG